MGEVVERGSDWAGLPLIATVARLLCRELTLQNEYLCDCQIAMGHARAIPEPVP